jgi:hypothetical protein
MNLSKPLASTKNVRPRLNDALRRALAALAHPLAVGALALLLVNDHVLRRNWPGPWTGKLGDAAWLIFAPLALAAALAVLLPRRMANRTGLCGALAFGLAGAAYALGNTVPLVHRAIIITLSAVIGRPAALVMDPTDLLMLPALALGWWAWRAGARTPRAGWSPAWLLLAAGIAASLANSGPPQPGIACFVVGEDGTILATSPFLHTEEYTSADGGLTWGALDPGGETAAESCTIHSEESWTLADPADPGVVYRFDRGRAIFRSEDGGATWDREFSLSGAQARTAYYERTRPAGAETGPLDAVIHEPTGNLIAAMGHDGGLVRTPDGAWRWVPIGPYERVVIDTPGEVGGLLGGEIVLALLAGVVVAAGAPLFAQPRRLIGAAAMPLLGAALLALYAGRVVPGQGDTWFVLSALAAPLLALAAALLTRGRRGWLFFIVALALNSLIVLSATAPAINWHAGNYLAIALYGMALVAGLLALAAVVASVWTLPDRTRGAIIIMIAAGLLAAALFVAPVVLWAVGVIAGYHAGLILSWVMIAGVMAAAGLILRGRFPALAARSAPPEPTGPTEETQAETGSEPDA